MIIHINDYSSVEKETRCSRLVASSFAAANESANMLSRDDKLALSLAAAKELATRREQRGSLFFDATIEA